jgi:hypothetical protein
VPSAAGGAFGQFAGPQGGPRNFANGPMRPRMMMRFMRQMQMRMMFRQFMMNHMGMNRFGMGMNQQGMGMGRNQIGMGRFNNQRGHEPREIIVASRPRALPKTEMVGELSRLNCINHS